MKSSVLTCVLLVTLCSLLNGQSKLFDAPVVATRAADQELGGLVTKGKLVSHAVRLSAGTIYWYVYQTPKGELFILSGRIGAINELLKQELPTESEVMFLQDKFLNVLVNTMESAPSYLINNGFILKCASENSTKTNEMLQKYASGPSMKIEKEVWVLEVYVASVLGGIERWGVRGGLRPLRIQSFSREIVAPDRSFIPPLVSR